MKQIISQILTPLPLVSLFLVSGLYYLLLNRRIKRAAFLSCIGFLLLYACSLHFIPDRLLIILEKQAAQRSLLHLSSDFNRYVNSDIAQHFSYIVVLGGACVDSRIQKDLQQLNRTSISRLLEGLRLHKLHKGSKLVLSGGLPRDKTTAEAMKEMATSLGIEEENIILETTSHSTRSQATKLKEMLREGNYAVVTSAYHMPRTLMLFHEAGLDPVPFPTDYLVNKPGPASFLTFLPKANNIMKIEIALHEYLGMLWIKFRQLF